MHRDFCLTVRQKDLWRITMRSCREVRSGSVLRNKRGRLMELLGDMADRYVFSSMAIYKMEVSESAVIDYLMERLVQAALYFDTKESRERLTGE